MNRAAISLFVFATSLASINLACSDQDADEAANEPEKDYVVFGEFINPEDSLPRIRYFDGGLVSLNDRCAVRKVRLNPKMPAVYVNGQPIGFC
jgi:hypothetical protein